MILTEVVIDTNVLMHADDPRQAHQADAQRRLAALREGPTRLCVDEGFDVDPARNRSLIGGEYHALLTPTHTATGVVAHLFANSRISFVRRTVPPAIKKYVEQSVRNKRDRTFLFVAYNSADRTLCSQDFQDMQRRKRRDFQAKTKLRIIVTAELLRAV